MPTRPKTTPTTPPPLPLRDRLPEKARLQLFVYDRIGRCYRSMPGRHRVFILRSEVEAERFWAELTTLVEQTERWME